MTEAINQKLGEKLANELITNNGPLISGELLWKSIGFTSATAFRQAVAQDRIGIPVFSLPKRRGTYAFTNHVADWLKSLAEGVEM